MLAIVLTAVTLWFALVPQPPVLPLQGETFRHALAFLVLPLVTGLAFRHLGLISLWLVFAAFGGLIELLQLQMQLGRQAQWSDWYVDLAALSVALAVLWGLRRAGALLQRLAVTD